MLRFVPHPRRAAPCSAPDVCRDMDVAELHSPINTAVQMGSTLTVLDDDAPRTVPYTIQQLTGRQMLARLPVPILAERASRSRQKDTLVLGEVLACWSQGDSVFVRIELHEALTGIHRTAVPQGRLHLILIRQDLTA